MFELVTGIGRVLDRGRVFDLRERLVLCSTVVVCRPEKELGRVFDLRKGLVVCSTLERDWLFVRPWSCV